MEKSNANWDDVLLSIGRLKIPPHIVNVLLLNYENIILMRVMYLKISKIYATLPPTKTIDELSVVHSSVPTKSG